MLRRSFHLLVFTLLVAQAISLCVCRFAETFSGQAETGQCVLLSNANHSESDCDQLTASDQHPCQMRFFSSTTKQSNTENNLIAFHSSNLSSVPIDGSTSHRPKSVISRTPDYPVMSVRLPLLN